MMGWRVGYLAYKDRDGSLSQQLRKVQDTIPICPPQLSMEVALQATKEGRSWVTQRIQGILQNRSVSNVSFLATTSALSMKRGLSWVISISSTAEIEITQHSRKGVNALLCAVISSTLSSIANRRVTGKILKCINQPGVSIPFHCREVLLDALSVLGRPGEGVTQGEGAIYLFAKLPEGNASRPISSASHLLLWPFFRMSFRT